MKAVSTGNSITQMVSGISSVAFRGQNGLSFSLGLWMKKTGILTSAVTRVSVSYLFIWFIPLEMQGYKRARGSLPGGRGVRSLNAPSIVSLWAANKD